MGLGSDRNDFHVETRGSERTDCTELGFQHYVVLNPGDGTGDGSRGSRTTQTSLSHRNTVRMVEEINVVPQDTSYTTWPCV